MFANQYQELTGIHLSSSQKIVAQSTESVPAAGRRHWPAGRHGEQPMNSMYILYFACHKNTTSVILYYYDTYRRCGGDAAASLGWPRRPPPANMVAYSKESEATKARRK